MCSIFSRRNERGCRIPWPLKMVGALIFIPGLLFLGTWVTMMLWNLLMPAIFGLTVITFWQALGLIVLARILFGGHPGGHGRFPRKPRFKDREAWKDHMRERFADGHWNSHGSRRGHYREDPDKNPDQDRPISDDPNIKPEN